MLEDTQRKWEIPIVSAPCKGIQDSLGFWMSRRGFRIPGTGSQPLSVELRFWIAIVSGIPDSLSRIPIPKPRIPDSIGKIFLDSRFHKQKFP